MAYSTVSYIGDGQNTYFAIPFRYISKSHIKVFVDDVATTSFTFQNDQTLRLGVIPAAGQRVTIKRETPRTGRLVDFQDAATLTEAALDKDSDQSFFLAQEAFDTAEAIAVSAVSEQRVNEIVEQSKTDTVLKGIPTAETAPADTQTDQLATTAFVTEADKRRIHYTGVFDAYDANTPPDGWPDSAETWLETSTGKGWPSDYGRVVTYRGRALGADRARQMFFDGSSSRIYERRAVDAANWSSWNELWGDWNATPEAPASVTMQNAWTTVSGKPAPSVYKDRMGRVWLSGVIGGGTVGSAAFTVDEGYRPAEDQTLYTISNDAVGKIIITTLGEVIPVLPSSNVYVSLDALSWRTGTCRNEITSIDLKTSLSGTDTIVYSRTGVMSYLADAGGFIRRKVYLPNEASFTGVRRVRNIMTSTEDLSNTTAWPDYTSGLGTAPARTANYGGVADPKGTFTATRLQLSTGGGTAMTDFSGIRQVYSEELGWLLDSVWMRTTQPGATATISLQEGTAYDCAVTNTWQRFTRDFSGHNKVAFSPIILQGSNGTTADILVWHPQCEDKTDAVDQAVSEYVSSERDYGAGIKGVAYFDVNQDGSQITTGKGILTQQDHNNLVQNSEDYTATTWSRNLLVVDNAKAFLGPDGKTYWPKLTEDNVTNGFHFFGAPVTTVAGQPIRFSFVQKHVVGDRETFRAQIYRDTPNLVTLEYSLATLSGTLSVAGYTNASYEIVDLGGGFIRITMFATDPAGGTSTCRAYPIINGSAGYVGDNTKGMYLTEFDVEQLPTTPLIRPYVPSGLNEGGKMNLDVSTKLRSKALQLSFYWEPLSDNQGEIYFFAVEKDASNGLYLFHDGTSLIFRKRSNGVNYDAIKPFDYVIGTTYKIAVSHGSSGMQVYVNDVAGTAHSDNSLMPTSPTMQLFHYNGKKQPYGYFRDFDMSSNACGNVAAPAPTTPAPSQPAAFNPAYPRIAGCNISAKNYDDPAYQTALSKAHWVILGFYYKWKTGYSYTAKDGQNYTGMRAAVKAIKDKNPAILVGQYTLFSDAPLDSNTSTTWGTPGQTYEALDYKPEKLDAMDSVGKPWWLYKINSDGTKSKVTWTNAFSTYDVNITAYTQPDSNGERYAQWLAKKDNSIFFSPVPEFDFCYFDNVFEKCRVASADFKCNGTNVSADSVASEYRQGHADQWKQFRALQPKLYMMGNIDHDYSKPEFKNAEAPLNGGMYEGAIGKNWSLPIDQAKTRYHGQVANVAEPKLVMFHGVGAANDYKTMRLTLCMTLMDNGYCFYGPDYNSLPWFDEYDNAGAGKGYLGMPIEPPQLTPYENGIYRRKFENGVVFLNISSDGQPSTVTLDRNYKRIAGTQDTTTNSGAAISKGTPISIYNMDGLILLNN